MPGYDAGPMPARTATPPADLRPVGEAAAFAPGDDPVPARRSASLAAGVADAVRPGLTAVRRSAVPFVLIQLAAVGVVACYYAWPATREAFAALGRAKVAGGVVAAALASAVAGGLLPEVAKLAARAAGFRVPEDNAGRSRAGAVAFTAFAFAVNGAIVEPFYRLQGHWFGDAQDVTTIAKKLAVDCGLFTPLLMIPLLTAIFRLHANRLSIRRTAAEWGGGFYRRRVLPVLAPCWAYWVPMAALIYALPDALQFVLFIPALAAWSLIVTFVTAGE